MAGDVPQGKVNQQNDTAMTLHRPLARAVTTVLYLKLVKARFAVLAKL